MRIDTIGRPAALLLLGGFLVSVAACHKTTEDNAPAGPAPGATVWGKVTFKGQPVPYGVVLFYQAEKAMDPRTGNMVPSSAAMLRPDGTYEITGAPVGVTMVAIATDPDVDIGTFMAPVMPGGGPGGARAGGTAGAAPGPAAPPAARRAADPRYPRAGRRRAVPPDRRARWRDDRRAPPGPLGGGARGGLPPGLPPEAKPPAAPWAPELTDAQKKMLKEVHSRFGIAGRSPLALEVKDGEQTHDFPLD